MRHLVLLMLVAVLLASGACSPTTHNNQQTTTINIYGPFSACTVILLPTGRGVSFGERGVTILGDTMISVGGITYTVDLASCNATTMTTAPAS